jgi:predicted transcriptional regulator
MSWYKKAQKIPTMENIIWAIDKLIAENYDFSVEELIQASQGNQQYALPKAAQTATKRKYRKGVGPKLENISRTQTSKIFDLFEKGTSTTDIAKQLGITSPEVSMVLKTRYPSKIDQTGYLSSKLDQNILNTTEDMRQEMMNDFNIRSINSKQIAAELGIDPKYVTRVLKDNGINLIKLSTERKNLMAQCICDIVNSSSAKTQGLPPGKLAKYVIDQFRQKYNFTLSQTGVNSALRLNNLGDYNKNDPDFIFKSFTDYMNGIVKGGRSIFFTQPDKLPMYIDKFFQRYGERNGFLPLKERRSLELYLTKKQIEENTKNMERNKYTPVDYSDQNPATFLYDRD